MSSNTQRTVVANIRMVVELMPYKVQCVGLSDIGLVRDNNEDVWAEIPKRKFFILADGMGGHQAGEIAARQAVDAVCALIQGNKRLNARSLELEEASSIISDAMVLANTHVYKMGRKDVDLRGMGTTLCCLYFHSKGLVYGHVGDSRIYRLRNKKLHQLTQDHSLLRELLDLGQINEQQAEDFVHKNIITKAIGTESIVHPSVHISEVFDKDIYLMCSDGLSDMLVHNEIETIMNQPRPLKEMAKELIESAKKRGGNDNVTVVMVKITQGKHETKDLSR
jgi:serine/threonine protein phosphatase PrpC